MRSLAAFAALAVLLVAASTRADDDNPFDEPPDGLPALPDLPPLPPLPDLPPLSAAPAPASTPAPTLAPSPTPALTPTLAPSPSPTPALLSIPATPSATLGQYDEYERPIAAYSIDAGAVTAAAYDACVSAGRCTKPSCAAASRDARVTCVDLTQANAYCAFAGGRLPSEEEWEHAAREARSLGMRSTDDAAEWTSSPYCYFCGRDDQVVRGGPARNPGLRGWRAPATRDAGVGFRCARDAS